MTVTVNVSSLAWAACAALFVARYADRWIGRMLTLKESAQRAQFHPAMIQDGPGTPIPDDLIGMINGLSTGSSESDELLRQQTLALLYEKAAEYDGDWDKVRAWSAVNIAGDTRADGYGHA